MTGTYPSLRAHLEADLKSAMRDGETTRRDTIRFLLAGLKNAEIERRGPLPPSDETALLQRQVKRMAESIEQFTAGGRTDLAERETAQLEITRSYLPTELSDDELTSIVREAISSIGASTIKDLGRVMPVAIDAAAGRADGKRLSNAVRQALTIPPAT